MNPLTDEQIDQNLKSLPSWEIRDGQLFRKIKLARYMDAFSLAEAIGQLAEDRNHHPDLSIGWRSLEIHLTTHSAGGMTALDFELASAIDPLVKLHDA